MRSCLTNLVLSLTAIIASGNIETEARGFVQDNGLKNSTDPFQSTTCNDGVNGINAFTIPADSPNGPITFMHIQYDASRAVPLTSTTYHDSMNKIQAVERDDNFRPWDCPQLPVPDVQPNCRVTFKMTPEQQQLSGYTSFDRGHMAPVNPYRFHFTAMDNTFYCVNNAPQEPFTNQQPWNVIEQTVLQRTTAGYVVTGLCSEDGPDGVTEAGITVPSCFWKMVCYEEGSETYVVGFIGENSLFDRTDEVAKDIRTSETKEPRSQADIIQRHRGDSSVIRQAWQEATVLLTNRESDLAPNVQNCINRLDLPSDISDDWRSFVREVSLEIENGATS